VNPAVIARNHQVESALAAAVERGDFKQVERLLDVLSNPMAVAPENAEFRLPPVGGDANYQTFCGT
jgi:serine/tyrosine/threonine adenylyltransferase